jgi:hypothetical protein
MRLKRRRVVRALEMRPPRAAMGVGCAEGAMRMVVASLVEDWVEEMRLRSWEERAAAEGVLVSR